MTIHDHIKAVLAGELPLDSLGPCAMADVALPIYARACEILALPVYQRRAEIERHPLSGLLAAEVKRIWETRRTVNTGQA